MSNTSVTDGLVTATLADESVLDIDIVSGGEEETILTVCVEVATPHEREKVKSPIGVF